MRYLIIPIALLFLSACATNMQSYSRIDQSNKTITVPAGASGLKGKLKKVLSDNGWKMMIYRGPQVVEGSSGKNTHLQKYDTFNSRYKLAVESVRVDLCMTKYDISVIDNNDGSEAFALAGYGCEAVAVKAFTKAIQGAQP